MIDALPVSVRVADLPDVGVFVGVTDVDGVTDCVALSDAVTDAVALFVGVYVAVALNEPVTLAVLVTDVDRVVVTVGIAK